MRTLIANVRAAIPFDAPEGQVCTGSCDGCSLKLLNFLADELDGWEQRLAAGERPGLLELSRLSKTCRRVYQVLERNGVIAPLPARPAEAEATRPHPAG